MNEYQRVESQCFSRYAPTELNMFRLIHFSGRTSQQLNQWRNVCMYGAVVSALSVLSHPGPQDVTFLSIQEITLHHKDVARQHPHCAHFLFYDNVAMSDFSQQK